MAHSSTGEVEGFVQEYADYRTAAAAIGLLYVIFGAITFGMMTSPTFMPDTAYSFSLTAEIAGWVALGSLVLGFLASKTRDPAHYHMAEKVVVGVSIVSVPAVQYTDVAGQYLNSHPLLLGIAGTVLTVVAFVIVVR